MTEDELQSALAKLIEAELIYARGIAPEVSYQFKHALVRDTAYDALLKGRRKELHRLVAQALTEKFADVAETQRAVVAQHWTEAGESDLAVAAWQRAGEAARDRHAFKEAIDSYRQALAIVSTRPESSERDARKLELTNALIPVLQLIRGYAAPETMEAIEHVRVLAAKTGDLMGFRQIHATWAAANTAGDYRAAGALADRMLELAQSGSAKAVLERRTPLNSGLAPTGANSSRLSDISCMPDRSIRNVSSTL